MKILPRSDRALQLSRRLDWRFLLPEPSLGSVAYWGLPQDPLALALKEFCAALTIVPLHETTSPLARAAFEVAVLTEPAFAQLEQAQQCLQPNGRLYAEVQHAWHWRASRNFAATRPPHVSAWQSELARLGFVDIALHWHRPNFEHALQIIPLPDKSAMDFVFKRKGQAWMKQLAFATGRTVVNQPWLARWLQCVSLVARKP